MPTEARYKDNGIDGKAFKATMMFQSQSSSRGASHMPVSYSPGGYYIKHVLTSLRVLDSVYINAKCSAAKFSCIRQ